MHVSHVRAQVIQDGKSILLTQLLVTGIVLQEWAQISVLLCPNCIQLSPLLMGTGEVIPLGAIKLITICVHSHAGTLINDYLCDVAGPSVVKSEFSWRAHRDPIVT
jgi:hypothetical protein